MAIPAIFTLNDCLHCYELKHKLVDLSIPFHSIDITKNKELWEYIVEQTGSDLTPIIFIPTDKTGNGVAYVPERDFQNIDEIIEIIKKNI